LLLALEQSQTLGIDFESVTQTIDTSGPMGKLVFSGLAEIAEFERELIKERVVAGMKEAQRQGKHCVRRSQSKEFDIEKAAKLRESGLSLCAIDYRHTHESLESEAVNQQFKWERADAI
jgi:DNA invertase Pin-like site-specific DNA recombinase